RAATGRLAFNGTIGTSGTSGMRKVISSVVVAKGVFAGVGKIVEVANRPGDSDKLSRDDLVFAGGVLHISSVVKKVSLDPDPKACTFKLDIKQTGAGEGGTGRFAHATGTFAGGVTGQALAARQPN